MRISMPNFGNIYKAALQKVFTKLVLQSFFLCIGLFTLLGIHSVNILHSAFSFNNMHYYIVYINIFNDYIISIE